MQRDAVELQQAKLNEWWREEQPETGSSSFRDSQQEQM